MSGQGRGGTFAVPRGLMQSWYCRRRENVRYPVRSGEHILTKSFTARDPERTSMSARETSRCLPICTQLLIGEQAQTTEFVRLIATDPGLSMSEMSLRLRQVDQKRLRRSEIAPFGKTGRTPGPRNANADAPVRNPPSSPPSRRRRVATPSSALTRRGARRFGLARDWTFCRTADPAGLRGPGATRHGFTFWPTDLLRAPANDT